MKNKSKLGKKATSETSGNWRRYLIASWFLKTEGQEACEISIDGQWYVGNMGCDTVEHLLDEFESIITKVEQEAYKKGQEDQLKKDEIKISGLQAAFDHADGEMRFVKVQPYEHILEVEEAKQQGLKEGLERAYEMTRAIHSDVAKDLRKELDAYIQQQLTNLNDE